MTRSLARRIQSMYRHAFSCRRSSRKQSQASLCYPPDFDDTTIRIIEHVRPYTMTSIERISALCSAIRYVTAHNIPGAIVECGVWKGGSMMAAALMLQHLNITDRDLYLFDTFSGMPPATSRDRNCRGEDGNSLVQKSTARGIRARAYSSIDEVRTNLHSTLYDQNRIHMISGKVEDTLPGNAPEQIALLRLDTDWYSSTYHEMTHLFPRLTDQGILIIDDYGHWQGAKQAVDQYLQENDVCLFLSRIDYTGRLGVKSA